MGRAAAVARVAWPAVTDPPTVRGAPAPPEASRWRASPRRLARLVVGLWLFGTGEGLIVVAALGNSPWTVLAEGVEVQTPLSVGAATIVISGLVLLLWLPLRQRPGLGTVANAVLVGVALDATVGLAGGPHPPALRVVLLLGGVALVALGSGVYLGVALGPGPRDGLMTGLHRRTGLPLAGVRAGIEVSALVLGALLGGTWGVGTLVFALTIGPGVVLALRLVGGAPPDRL